MNLVIGSDDIPSLQYGLSAVTHLFASTYTGYICVVGGRMMDIKLIEEAYGLKIRELRQIRNVYRADTDCGIKSFKRAHMSPSYFLFLYSAVNHLLKNGFEGVIPYAPTVDGRICIQDGTHIYYAADWLESRECKFKDRSDLNRAIKAAAGLHKASHGYVPPETAKPRVYYNKWVDKFEKKCIELLEFSKTIEDKGYIDAFDEVFAKHLAYYWNQGKQSIAMLGSCAYADCSRLSREKGEFCHHDMANHNFLITPDDRTYLIDFDYSIMDTRLHDVSSLVIRNMRYGVWDLGKAYHILNEYDRQYTLSKEELEVIKAFMTFPQDFWQVGLQYYVENQPWTMEFFMMRLNRVVDDRDKRDQFLSGFLRI